MGDPDLEALEARLTDAGYGVVRRAYFAEEGLLVFRPVQHGDMDGSDRRTFVYRSDPPHAGWTLRITPHGGPHWLKRVGTVEAVEEELRRASRWSDEAFYTAPPRPAPGWTTHGVDICAYPFLDLFERLYRRRPQGIGDGWVRTPERRLEMTLPDPLRAFYWSCGAETVVTDTHDRLHPLARLTVQDERLVFCEENQGACLWACRLGAADPPVEADDGPDGWRAEGVGLTRFLEILIVRQALGGGYPLSYGRADGEPAWGAIAGSWDELVDHRGIRIYGRRDLLVGRYGPTDDLYGAARTEDAAAHLRELGFTPL